MTGNDYMNLAKRSNDGKATKRLQAKIGFFEGWKEDFGGLIMACLGLSGEVGEFNDMVKKWVFHEKELDETHLKKELGDICWYIALVCQSMGWNLDEILQMNIDKLSARYPNGFDVNKANNRKSGDI